jgi:uncharacterized protein YqgV (UPF0045/DUF77 family)
MAATGQLLPRWEQSAGADHESDRPPNGTVIEGEWEPVFAAIEACHQAVHAMGCPLEDKVASVQALL